MSTSLFTVRTLSALTLAAALTACGGGGGGSAEDAPGLPGDSGETPITSVDAAGTLQATVPAATYTGTFKSAFDALNVARGNAGAGLIAQSSLLDAAATAHAKYLTTNQVVSHEEDASLPDYYEATHITRIAKAGYEAGYATEVIGGTGASLQGADCVLGLLNTVYHATSLLSEATDIGIGFGTDSAGFPLCVANPAASASTANPQVPAAGSFIAYPYDGQSNVLETFFVGYESPRPPASLFPNLTAGTPVVVSVRNADYVNAAVANTLDVQVTKFEVKDAGGNLVPAGILSCAGISASGVTMLEDANLKSGFVVLVPLSPLTKGVTYTVSFDASITTGKTLSKTWSFTTNP